MMFPSLLTTMLVSMAHLGPALAQTANYTGPTLRSLSYGGTGCPQGSLKFSVPINSTREVSPDISPGQITDRQYRIVVAFEGYAASIGKGVSITQARKNCQVNLNLDYPIGYRFAVAGSSFSGYAALGEGVSAVHKSTYYFSGYSAQTSTQSNFSGPVNAPYDVSGLIQEEELWSPCGQSVPLNVNNQVRINGGSNSTGEGTLYDSGIFDISLVWQTCAP